MARDREIEEAGRVLLWGQVWRDVVVDVVLSGQVHIPTYLSMVVGDRWSAKVHPRKIPCRSVGGRSVTTSSRYLGTISR